MAWRKNEINTVLFGASRASVTLTKDCRTHRVCRFASLPVTCVQALTMDIDAIRKHCLSFPHATENVQWGFDLCFKVDGKLFAVAPLEVAPVRLSFKCTPEDFADLCERQSIIPAPYMARAQWVALESLDAVPDKELRTLLAQSYALVWERLPKKRREALGGGSAANQSGKPAAPRKSHSGTKGGDKAAKTVRGPRK
jgi:predicted DNA-binding protein (MmcQ/YjbR family)